MNRTILLLIFLFLFLAACQSPTPTAFLQPSSSRTSTSNPTETLISPSATLEPFQVTMLANQTQNAIYNATVGARVTATAIAMATLQSLPPTETPTLTSTITPTPTRTPLPSPTPLPPLVAHTWNPATVLVLYESFGGDGGLLYPLPRLVLYGDGQLFKGNRTKQLEREEMCAFLNTIDQFGYLYYSPDTYLQDLQGNLQKVEDLNFDGSGTARINVNIWDGIFGQYYGLFYAIYFNYSYPICPECERAPTVYPALSNTFVFLEDYQPENMEVYVPQNMEIWVESTQFSSDLPVWPISTIRLFELDDPGNRTPIIITGDEAKQMYEEIWLTDAGPFFSEDSLAYYVTIRPVYPYPWETEEKYPGIPDTLTCTPEDGVLEIPTGE